MYKFYTKLWLVMRLTTILLLVTLLQVSAETLAQKITLHERNSKLETVLQEIRKQSGYDIVYDDRDIAPDQKVSVSITNADLEDALNRTFQGLPLSYDIKGNIISIKKKTPTFPSRTNPVVAAIDVHGRIVDEKNLPITGVTIRLKDQTQVTTTDNDGHFYLFKVNENARIIISSIGFTTKEINSAVELGTILLEKSSSKLDEVQIVAYGTTSQRLSTSNVSSVKAIEISKSPIQNPLLAIQGRAPGIFIEQSTGFSNSGIKVRIQGQNSIGSGNDPLYVIDNVPYPSQMLPNNSTALGLSGAGTTARMPGAPGNPLSYLNPADIESIDILKDADATAIYGSRAANGAILITTKKGTIGDSKINLNVQQGYGSVGHKIKLLNNDQYLAMRREALKNDQLTATSDQGGYDFSPELTVYDQNLNTNWQSLLIGGTAKFTDLNTSISGGNTNVQYLFGLGYKRQTTVFPTDIADQKGSFHFNLSSLSSNKKFKFSLTTNYLYDNDNTAVVDLTSVALTLPPNGKLYNDDGSLYFATLENGNTSFPNPLVDLLNKNKSITKNLIANGTLEYRFAKNFSFKTSFGYNDLSSSETGQVLLASQYPEAQASFQRVGNYSSGSISTWIVEPQLNYSRFIGKGFLRIFVGSTFQSQHNIGQKLTGTGFVNDNVIEDINSANYIFKSGSTANIYNYNAIFGQINYNWLDKYILSLTGRRDGSSRFGASNRFQNFGSLGGAWLFSNEGFFKENTLLSLGKLKISYGSTGNDQIGDYNYLSRYITADGQRPYQGGSSLQPNSISNPYLQWELTKKFNMGIDLGFFKDRLLFNVNHYVNKSSNQLAIIALPSYTGNKGILQNFPGTVQNSGWELGLSWANDVRKSLKWSTGFNLTIPRNKLTSFPGLETSTSAENLIIGQPLNIIKAYKYAGVNSTTGIYQFKDHNGNLIDNPTNDPLDRFVVLQTDPKFYGGMQSTLSYNGFQIDVLIQYVKQSAYQYSGSTPGQPLANQPVEVLNRWIQSGDHAIYQQYATGLRDETYYSESYVAQSDRDFKDASFLRVKNLSLSWQVPSNWREAMHLRNARIYLQGQNLMTLTKYIGLDPETRSAGGLPPLKMISMGFQLDL